MKLIKLKGKDLIVIAIFTIIIIVIEMAIGMACMMLLGMHFSMLFSGVAGLFVMPVFMLMAAKVKKPGVLFIYALLSGLIYTIMSTPLMLLISIVPAIIGELIISAPKKNASLGYNAIGYTFFRTVYSLHGTFLILLLGKDNFKENGTWFSEEQISQIFEYGFAAKSILITAGVTAIACTIGYFIGRKILRKNFEKAGVI